MQRTEAIVHLDRLKRNIQRVQMLLDPDVTFIGVLKGDAYGHGISGVYPTFKACGINTFAVAIWNEGLALRKAGAKKDTILILGDTWDEDLEFVVEYRLTPTVFTFETAEKLNALAKKRALIQPVSIKIDTGMNRIGFKVSEENADTILKISNLSNIKITSIFTHFAQADETDSDATEKQVLAFETMLGYLKTRGLEMPMIHCSNSPAILLRPELQAQAVRAGDVLYGLCPIDDKAWEASDFEEVMTWETYVALVKTIPEGEAVGYGGTFVTKRTTTIATLPVGFADGYSRHLSNKGYVIINGRQAPILGRVCMDQMMVDVTDIPDVERGTKVSLLDGKDISILKMANLLDSNVDEIVTAITKRVPRKYSDH